MSLHGFYVQATKSAAFDTFSSTMSTSIHLSAELPPATILPQISACQLFPWIHNLKRGLLFDNGSICSHETVSLLRTDKKQRSHEGIRRIQHDTIGSRKHENIQSSYCPNTFRTARDRRFNVYLHISPTKPAHPESGKVFGISSYEIQHHAMECQCV